MKWVLALSLVVSLPVAACGGKTSSAAPAPDGGDGSGGTNSGFSVCQQFFALLQKVQQNSSEACAQCVVQTAQSGPCVAAFSSANAVCGSNDACQNSCSGDAGVVGDPTSECSCHQSCSSPACWSAATDAMQCMLTACASSC